MKENNTYNEELGGRNLPHSLRVNPFSIPNNYFEYQEEQILNCIRLDQQILSIKDGISTDKAESNQKQYFDTLENSILAKISEQNLKNQVTSEGFIVPDQYFDHINIDIESKIVENNLKSIAPSLDFGIPEDYFKGSEEKILAEVDLYNKIGNDAGFIVPNSYFNELSANIETNIAVDNLRNTIGFDSFAVPAGYFDQLTDKILAKSLDVSKQETKIRTLPKHTTWRKYSAAAAIVALIGVGSYFAINTSDSMNNQLATSQVNVDHLSDEEILSYLAQVSEGEDLIHLSQYASSTIENNVELDSDIDKKEIEEYLNYML